MRSRFVITLLVALVGTPAMAAPQGGHGGQRPHPTAPMRPSRPAQQRPAQRAQPRQAPRAQPTRQARPQQRPQQIRRAQPTRQAQQPVRRAPQQPIRRAPAGSNVRQPTQVQRVPMQRRPGARPVQRPGGAAARQRPADVRRPAAQQRVRRPVNVDNRTINRQTINRTVNRTTINRTVNRQTIVNQANRTVVNRPAWRNGSWWWGGRSYRTYPSFYGGYNPWGYGYGGYTGWGGGWASWLAPLLGALTPTLAISFNQYPPYGMCQVYDPYAGYVVGSPMACGTAFTMVPQGGWVVYRQPDNPAVVHGYVFDPSYPGQPIGDLVFDANTGQLLQQLPV